MVGPVPSIQYLRESIVQASLNPVSISTSESTSTPTLHPDPLINSFLSELPAKTAASFTPNQLEAIKRQFGNRKWTGSHPVDIRLSIPFIGRGFYLVFLMGRERRSKERLRNDQVFHPFWKLGNAVAIASVLGIVLASTATLYWLVEYQERAFLKANPKLERYVER